MISDKDFNKGILLASLGSVWWGFVGVIYFKYISFVGHIEVLIHRCIWTTVMLFFTSLLLSKFKDVKKIIINKKKLFLLFISGLLIFTNWGVWIYAVSSDKIIDASFGYFIMPIISVFLGNFFFKEKINFKRKLSISIVIFSIILMFIFNVKSIPWVGLIVALSWSFYNLIRKKIDVSADTGLFIESLFLFPAVLICFYFIIQNGHNDFEIGNIYLSLTLILAGPMTVIPLYFYIKGVEHCGLGPSGMIFYITPTLQFLLGFFIYDEALVFQKLLSFILIWIAVFIYLKDLYENN